MNGLIRYGRIDMNEKIKLIPKIEQEIYYVIDDNNIVIDYEMIEKDFWDKVKNSVQKIKNDYHKLNGGKNGSS